MRIHTVIILAALLSGIAALAPFAWTGTELFSSFYRDSVRRELESGARLFSLAIATPEGPAGGDIRASIDAARLASGARLTVIRRDGSVVADSDEAAERMENHLNRPEIQSALAGEIGVETRSSPTLGTDWMYVAIPMPDGTVVRAAASMAELNERLGRWLRGAFIGLAASLILLVLTALAVSRMLSRPIEAAAAGAERYASGDLSYRSPATGPAELRRLGRAMDTMAAELEARLGLVTRQREEMAVVFENMSEGVLAVDDGGRILLLNAAAHSLLGLSGDATGGGIEVLVGNADLLDAILATVDQPIEKEIRVSTDGRSESLVHIHTARIRNGSTSVGVLVVLRDITRLRQLEIMRRDFIANVSHELRTPITTMQSCLETIIEDHETKDGSHRDFVEMALRNARRMGAIIDNLLFLAGMEANAGKEMGVTGSSLVEPVLEEAASLCRDDVQSRNATIRVDCEGGLTAIMNPHLITHAVVNLLDNAIKYGPDGGTVTVTARQEGDRVSITVSDEGPGIAPRYQSRVFERFYRVDGVARIKKGSGLGLAIVKHIALAHGGDIRLESEIGAGSRFTLSLPRAI